jgi:hypothetical protein
MQVSTLLHVQVITWTAASLLSIASCCFTRYHTVQNEFGTTQLHVHENFVLNTWQIRHNGYQMSRKETARTIKLYTHTHSMTPFTFCCLIKESINNSSWNIEGGLAPLQLGVLGDRPACLPLRLALLGATFTIYLLSAHKVINEGNLLKILLTTANRFTYYTTIFFNLSKLHHKEIMSTVTHLFICGSLFLEIRSCNRVLY